MCDGSISLDIYFTSLLFVQSFCHCLQEEGDEEEDPGKGEEYGAPVRTRATRRGGTTRGGGRTTTRRGLSRYRQTQRKPRSTVRSSRGSQRLNEGGIQLEEVQPTQA